MNPPLHRFCPNTILPVGCGLGLVLAALPALAPNSHAAKIPAPPATTNRASAKPEIPRSVFAIPATEKEGRDPFFPNSTRLRPVAPQRSTNRVQVVTADLQLKGISGPLNDRLAIINNQTLKDGEEADVTTATGRAHVRCLEIKTDSVIVEIAGQRRELRLRTGL